jgi:hypothetical protein
MKAKRSDRLIMLTCGRDNDWRSGGRVGANADRIWGMIIVDILLPKAMASTGSCARGVRVRRIRF